MRHCSLNSLWELHCQLPAHFLLLSFLLFQADLSPSPAWPWTQQHRSSSHALLGVWNTPDLDWLSASPWLLCWESPSGTARTQHAGWDQDWLPDFRSVSKFPSIRATGTSSVPANPLLLSISYSHIGPNSIIMISWFLFCWPAPSLNSKSGSRKKDPYSLGRNPPKEWNTDCKPNLYKSQLLPPWWQLGVLDHLPGVPTPTSLFIN